MSTKCNVIKGETFDLLDIRVGTIMKIELEPSAPKKAFRMVIDFGKFGVKTSVGRFAEHKAEELVGKQIIGIINFEPIKIGEAISEVLILGAQFSKADSGEATPLVPLTTVKIGGKIF